MKELDLKQVDTILPKGAKDAISKKSRVCYQDTQRIFKGLCNNNTPKVIEATKEYFRELKPIFDELFSQL